MALSYESASCGTVYSVKECFLVLVSFLVLAYFSDLLEVKQVSDEHCLGFTISLSPSEDIIKLVDSLEEAARR